MTSAELGRLNDVDHMPRWCVDGSLILLHHSLLLRNHNPSDVRAAPDERSDNCCLISMRAFHVQNHMVVSPTLGLKRGRGFWRDLMLLVSFSMLSSF